MTSSKKPKSMFNALTRSKKFSSKTGKAGSPLPAPMPLFPTSNPGSSKTFTESSAILKRRPEIAETMLAIANVIATRSTCVRRNVGAVLVDANNRVLSIGHNGPAKGMPHCTDKPCAGAECPSGTGLDLCQAIHAEQNALMFCHDIMKIDKCFVTTSPCVHCVKMLMNTSCKVIMFSETHPHTDPAKTLWLQDPTRQWVQV